MKTIKQIADELGVSKQAIRKEIANQKLQTSLQKNGNQFTLNAKQEKLIKSAFEQRKTQTENANKSQTNCKPVDSEVDRLIKENLELKKELKEEREYSRNLANKIADLADHAQLLEQNSQQLQAKFLLAMPQQNQEETIPINENETENHEEKRKSIFNKLFRK